MSLVSDQTEFLQCDFSIFCRYRVLLDNILSNNEVELIETLKLFIEASKFL